MQHREVSGGRDLSAMTTHLFQDLSSTTLNGCVDRGLLSSCGLGGGSSELLTSKLGDDGMSVDTLRAPTISNGLVISDSQTGGGDTADMRRLASHVSCIGHNSSLDDRLGTSSAAAPNGV